MPTAGSLHQQQQRLPSSRDSSPKQVALNVRPVLENLPQVEHVPWNKQTEVRRFCAMLTASLPRGPVIKIVLSREHLRYLSRLTYVES